MSVLNAVNIKKSFPTPAGALEVLRGVNLEIMAGECISVRGESGSGKTTLLQILGGLESATVGDLFWNGERVTKRGNAFLAKVRSTFLGYVFQAYHLVPELDALENVLLASRIAGTPTKAARKISLELLDRVGLGDRINHLPTRLSGGECQRVAIARALVNHPQLILADEPTGNLDEKTGDTVMTLLLDVCREQKASLLLVTHNKDFAELADRKISLKNGVLEEIS